MAMRCVFAKTDIGDDEEVWEGTAEEADSGDDGARRVVGGRAKGILCGWGKRDPEEDDRAKPLSDEGCEEADEGIEAAAVLIG